MAFPLGDQLYPQPPTTLISRPALVAYSDSDSESNLSETLAIEVELTATAERMDLAEGFLVSSVNKATSTDNQAILEPKTTAETQKQLWTTTINQDTAFGEGSKRHEQAGYHTANLGDNHETISDINNEHQNEEFEEYFGDADQEANGGTNKPQCWGDIKYPRIGTCDHEFKIVKNGERYRKVVSNFFGRNKRATASVPTDFYPKICRTCYQRLAYRLGSMNKDDPEKDAAAVAKLRCDAIIATLKKMKERKFIDRYGYEWPWWCGLELQLTNDGRALLDDPEGLEAEIEKKNGDVAKYKADRFKSPDGKSLKRLHKRIKPEYLPDWLQKLCQTNIENYATDGFGTSTIGDRNGVRYSFDELILIVKAIKTFCHASRCAFPTIEAVPVPIGLLDDQILKEKRKLRATANKERSQTKKAAQYAERDARDQPGNTVRKNKAIFTRKEADEAFDIANAAERAVSNAQEDALLSAETIPRKRCKPDVKFTRNTNFMAEVGEMKAEKVPESSRAIEKDDREVSEQEYVNDDDANDGDYEVTSTRKPRSAKRTRICTAKSKAQNQ